jgi:hypothetical protein
MLNEQVRSNEFSFTNPDKGIIYQDLGNVVFHVVNFLASKLSLL